LVTKVQADSCPGGTKAISGVLISCIKDTPSPTFFDYLSAVLDQNSGYIVAAAVIIVVASGIQYMTAFGSSGEQTKAKQRIISVITGIIFFTLIRFAVSLFASGLI